MECKPCEALKKGKGNITNILNGWSNLAFPSKEIEELAKSRLKECVKCEYLKPLVKVNSIQYYKCGQCSCPIDPLIRSTSEKCKIGKW